MRSTSLILSAPFLGLLLSGCVGINPVANSIGMAQAGVITPQEQAKYQAMSCSQLRQMTANYETSLTASPAAKKYGSAAGKPAIVMEVITTRLSHLKKLMASKGC